MWLKLIDSISHAQLAEATAMSSAVLLSVPVLKKYLRSSY